MTLTEAKIYLKIDGNDADIDNEIASLMLASQQFLIRTIGKTQVIVDENGIQTYKNISEDSLFNLANKLLLAHWYENRGIELQGNYTKISFSVEALINHFALCGDYI